MDRNNAITAQGTQQKPQWCGKREPNTETCETYTLTYLWDIMVTTPGSDKCKLYKRWGNRGKKLLNILLPTSKMWIEGLSITWKWSY